MAISDSEKLDFLWKKNFGVAKTASASDKFASNETVPSPVIAQANFLWSEADLIPATPPGSDTAQVDLYTGAARLALENDPTSPVNQTWLALEETSQGLVQLNAFIPSSFGSGYAVKVYIGDPNVGPAARIFPDTTGEEWVFDYAAGVLIFTGVIPANKPATIGVGTVSVATSGVYIEVYRYVGAVGGGSGDDLGTIAEQDADDVAITGGEISNVTLINVTVDGGWF